MFNQLAGEAVFDLAFRFQIVLACAHTQPVPDQWAREFVSKLHATIDSIEARHPSGNADYPERARLMVDALGHELALALTSGP